MSRKSKEPEETAWASALFEYRTQGQGAAAESGDNNGRTHACRRWLKFIPFLCEWRCAQIKFEASGRPLELLFYRVHLGLVSLDGCGTLAEMLNSRSGCEGAWVGYV